MGWFERLRGLLDREENTLTRGHGVPGTPVVAQETPIKSPPMDIDGRVMTADEFVSYVEGLEMPQPLPTRLFLHHTWKPTRESWRGQSTILAMKRYYEQQRWRDAQGRLHEGWTVGPHLFVADDGIWLFSDLRYDGVGVYGHNYRTRHLEIVGNYDVALPTGPTLENTVAALGVMHEKFGLDARQLYFHRDFSSKSCPGWALRKAWIIPQVERWIQEYRHSRFPLPKPKDELTSLRETLQGLIRDLLVSVNPETALTLASKERRLLGALTNEVPMEIGEQAYVVQLFAEALLVPVQEWDQIESLAEFEVRWKKEQDARLPEDDALEGDASEQDGKTARDFEAEMDALLSSPDRPEHAPPSDPYQFMGNIR